jgi:hypothetical protein
LSLSIRNLLECYYSVDDLKFALDLIGEPVSGTKTMLIDRMLDTWTHHRRNLKDLLEVLEIEQLEYMCQDYNLDDAGNKSILIKRILKSNIIDAFEKTRVPSSRVDRSTYMKLDRPQEQPDKVTVKSGSGSDVSKRNKHYYIGGGIGVAVLLTTLVLNAIGIFDRIMPIEAELAIDVTSSSVNLVKNVDPYRITISSEQLEKEVTKDVTVVIDNIGGKPVRDVYINMIETPRDQGWYNYHSKEVLEGYAEDTGAGDESYQNALNLGSKIRIKYYFSINPALYEEVKEQKPILGFYITYDGEKKESKEFHVCSDNCFR